MTRLACAAWAFVAVSLVAITPVASQPAPVPASAAKSAVSAAPSAARAVPATSAVPAAAGSALPAGHPATTAAGMPAGHGGAGGNRRAGIFRPRQNLVVVSEEVEPGIADVMIVDADERPLAGLPITLAILRSSVTKGEARSTREAVTDQQGRAMFRDLAVGSGMSYTLKAKRGEAEFASQPFGMKHKHGVKVLLHAYRPVTELSEAVVVMESIVALDIKEDSIAVNQLVRGLNLGRTAYVAKNVSMKLPPNFKAYNNQTSAGGVAMVERDGFAHLQGTFPPGSSEMTFRYQVPLTGDSSQTLKLPLPPRIVQTTIMVSAGPSMGLNVSGFPAARATRRRDGQRVLQTSKQVNPSAGIQQFLANTEPGLLEVTISGIPTPGPARWIAVALGVMAVVAGAIFLANANQRDERQLYPEERADLLEARQALLEEMALLERARHSGDVGPRSYQRLRTALLDALARILVQLDNDTAPALATAGGAPPPPAAPVASDSDAQEEISAAERRVRKRRRRAKRGVAGKRG